MKSVFFGLSLYGATTKANLDKMLLAQKKAVRKIMGLDWSDTAKDIFIELAFMAVYNSYIQETVLHLNNLKLPIQKSIAHQYYITQIGT